MAYRQKKRAMTFIYKTGRAELQDQIRRHAGAIGGRVLDVGAGSYPRYKNLFTCSEYVRMDVAAAEGVDAVGYVEDIPFPDGSFDSIVCTQVLGDVFDLPKAFNEMRRVLRQGGVLLVTESLMDPLHDEPHDFWRFTSHSLRRLAENATFAVEVLEARGGYHSIMAQLRARYWIERLHATDRWFARPLSRILKVLGERARRKDKTDTSPANKAFTHGYILIARKK